MEAHYHKTVHLVIRVLWTQASTTEVKNQELLTLPAVILLSNSEESVFSAPSDLLVP